MKINNKIKLRINKFDIEVNDWCVKKNFFWLKYDDSSSFGIHLEELKDFHKKVKGGKK